jgi:hypothetical protein
LERRKWCYKQTRKFLNQKISLILLTPDSLDSLESLDFESL